MKRVFNHIVQFGKRYDQCAKVRKRCPVFTDECDISTNCETTYTGRFCPQCGLKWSLSRMKLKNLLLNFMDIWGLCSRPMFRTIGELFIMSFVMRTSFLFVMSLMLTGCFFTGVESTQRVGEKEVIRAINEMERRQPSMTLRPFVDSVPAWQAGKQFYVADGQVRHLFVNAADDTLLRAGCLLTYVGRESGSVLDNREAISLKFASPTGMTYTYRTGKTIDQFGSSYSIPLLIDMDLVNHVDEQLRGQEVYIKTPMWYDLSSAALRRGLQFVKVRIDSVVPGDKALPLKVMFTATDNGERAYVMMSVPGWQMRNRDFDSLFSLRNMRENYPDISDSTWDKIVRSDLAVGMTKEECRLSQGSPQRISRLPDQAALREYWYYDGGSYLFFVDGRLEQFRR